MSPRSVVRSRLRVPFVDLGPTHTAVKARIIDDVSRLIDGGVFVDGPEVESFEEAFATYCRATHCVGVASGLDALRLSLLAAGIQRGDQVIVPAHTFIATLEAVTQAQGIPVLVDVTADDYNIDVVATEAAVTGRTRFLLPVHLYGQLADVRALTELADRHGLMVVEDACQAHGASRDGIVAGSAGLAAAFSFYPAKNLGAMGDAGAIVTDDAALASFARSLREHGQTAKYMHEAIGYTARLDCLQALVLLRKLEFLDGWIDQRRAAAHVYLEALEGVGDLVLPPVPSGSDPTWHLFVVRSARAEELAESLAERGIATGRHYPQPPHLSPAFAGLGYGRGSFPVTEALAAEVLSLPLFPGISEAQLAAVVEAIGEFFADG
jgi:dTDP-4-amino-4,6-dideoxygalactose transaminase